MMPGIRMLVPRKWRTRGGLSIPARRRTAGGACGKISSSVSSINLTNHFLIAMPNMADPYFSRTLTYVCEHNEQGALGIVVNRPIDMTLQALFERLSLKLKDQVY